jgi:flagellar assembly factor FliW
VIPLTEKASGLQWKHQPMPRVPTKFFGEVDYNADSVFQFPDGLPGFEDEREFLFLNVPQSEPVMFLQSVSLRNLCFLLVPILTLAPDFRIILTPQESQVLELPANHTPLIGKDVLCAALICADGKQSLYANLMAPIVVNLWNRLGVQAIHPESGHSHRHPITFGKYALAC